jgi:mannose-6-phosphate isomerase-like protein (cupin superfamily)
MDTRVRSLQKHRPTNTAVERRIAGDPRRAVLTVRNTYPRGHRIKPHWHERAQFAFALEGTMRVRTARRSWIVPPSRALWVPARTVHEIQMYGIVRMHSLYVDAANEVGMAADCQVLEVSPLLRELIVRAASVVTDNDDSMVQNLVVPLLLAEMRRLRPCALDLPYPVSGDLIELCESLLGMLADADPDMPLYQVRDISQKTLYRRFLQETGISFARWKKQAILLEAVRRLVEGAAVTTVAVDLGYENASSFSAMFRRSLGMAPREFAALAKSNSAGGNPP